MAVCLKVFSQMVLLINLEHKITNSGLISDGSAIISLSSVLNLIEKSFVMVAIFQNGLIELRSNFNFSIALLPYSFKGLLSKLNLGLLEIHKNGTKFLSFTFTSIAT
jgi:hypothetical protein